MHFVENANSLCIKDYVFLVFETLYTPVCVGILCSYFSLKFLGLPPPSPFPNILTPKKF